VEAEIENLSTPAPTHASETWTAAQVAARIRDLKRDLQRADADRVRAALKLVFDTITVTPLKGDWKNGWTLEMHSAAVVCDPSKNPGCTDSW